MKTLELITFAAIISLFAPVVAKAATPRPHRTAVLVGANEAAPGRSKLRYSHDDVRSVSTVLTDLGGFAANDIAALYDPEPSEVLKVLDEQLEHLAASGGESLLLFYYSGHADAHNLFPNGKPLPLPDIRARLENVGPSIRLGLVDACRGGGWTSVKGLVATEAFEIDLPMELSSEGSAFIASSSGLEDAHESEALGGSFFTHHWVAALRGAADRDEDGRITLLESFDYAKEMTIRDTALVADAPQHPSFQFNLRGRRDLPLAILDQQKTLLALDQSHGPLQLIDLRTGLIVLEIPAGKRKLKLAVPPGKYLVRRRDTDRTLAREVSVTSGNVTPINEANLEVMAMPEPVSKGGAGKPVNQTTLPDGYTEIFVSLGVRHGPPGNGLELSPGKELTLNTGWLKSFSDRLQWVIPTLGFAYRFGERGDLEWIPWGGLTSWTGGYSSLESFIFVGKLGLGTDVRWWLSPRSSINAGVGLTSQFEKSWGDFEKTASPTTWRLSATLGYSHFLGEYVSFHPAVHLGQNITKGGRWTEDGWVDDGPYWTRASFDSPKRDAVLTIGSVQTFGLRSLPLVQIHVGDVWSVDIHAAVSYSFVTQRASETYMLGSTWTW